MATPLRGEMYYIEVPQEYRSGSEEWGPHWHVVVSRNEINEQGNVVLVVPLTSMLSKTTGLPKDEGAFRFQRIRIPEDQKRWTAGKRQNTGDSLALTEQAFCLSQTYLFDGPCGTVTDDALFSIEAGLTYVFGLPNIGRRQPKPAVANQPLRPPFRSTN
jgi:hypothetical protein